jgi:MraZ protein
MLLGEYRHTIDEKGRMAVPAKFRQKFEDGAIITKGLDSCLFVLALNEWNIFAQKITTMPLAQTNSRAFARLMLASASDVHLDTQGRILIPEHLREYAKLQKNAVATGMMTRMEIWNADEWKRYTAETESAADEIAEKLSELGI